MRQPSVLASAKLLLGGAAGLRTGVSLSTNVDRRVMLMLAHDLLAALDQSGHLSPAVAQSRTAVWDQLAAWGIVNNPYIPTVSTKAPGSDRTIIW
jgi:hypothetical protein